MAFTTKGFPGRVFKSITELQETLKEHKRLNAALTANTVTVTVHGEEKTEQETRK